MQADIDRGVCEHRDCENPYAWKVTWTGATPAYCCDYHRDRNRHGDPLIERVNNPHFTNV